MYFYFFSDYSAVVKLQGIYYGKIGNVAKFCRIDPPYPLVEILSLSEDGRSYTFFPNEEFLKFPPKDLSVTDIRGGYLLRFFKTVKGGEFKIVAQEKFQDGSVTVFCDDLFKLSLETKSGFYAENLDFKPENAGFTIGSGASTGLLFCEFYSASGKTLCVYRTNTPALLLKKSYEEFTVTEKGFKIKEKLFDVAKHTVEYFYSFDGEKVTETERIVKDGDGFDRNALTDKILPYAFCEEFLVKGDYKFYLSDNIKENADKLKDYFGEFIGVTTPPLFRDYREVGLIKKISERRYAVDYFTFDVENGKIVNIKTE